MTQRMQSTELTTADVANVASRHEPGDSSRPEQPDVRQPEEQYSGPLLPPDFANDMRTRWEAVQTGFVDEPRAAVKEADELVASAIKKLAESFAEERAKLERDWSAGNEVSTEGLCQALRRYRAFFHRLLSL